LSVYDAFCEILPQRLARLQPMLQKYDFACDLYGLKPKAQIKSRYLLTSTISGQPLHAFSRELKPHEANIIANVSGQDIFLAETSSLVKDDSKRHLFDQLMYYFNELHDCQIESYPQLLKEVKALRKENQLLKEHDKENESNILKLEILMQQQQETINKQNSKLQETERIIKQYQDTINERNSRLKESEMQIKQQQETISEQKIRLEESEMHIKQQQDTINLQNIKIKEIETITIQQQQEINDKQVRLDEAKVQIDDFFNLINKKDAQIADKDQQIKQYFDALLYKDTEIKSMLLLIEQTTFEKEELAASLKEKLHNISELNSEISGIKDELSSINEELSISKADISLKESKIKSLESSIAENQSTIKVLQEQAHKKSAKVNELEDLIRRVEASYTFRIGKVIVWPARLIMGRKQ